MADKIISDYDLAGSIDPTADLFLMEQAGTNSYKSINRDTILGVTGQPADLTSVQSMSNKTLGNTNTITLLDTGFTLQDNSDPTKQAQFQLSSITAATTRTYTLPNASSTLADTSTAQTFTNKTLTSPVINGGSITNSTISVDSISEYTAANGVTVDGLNLKDGKLNTNNSVVTANITDSAVTPAKLLAGTGSSWSWQSWSPTWTNLTVGNGSLASVYTQIGKTVIARISLVFGASTSISGTVSFTLPVTSINYGLGGTAQPVVGWSWLEDTGNTNYQGNVSLASTTTGRVKVYTTSSTYAGTADLSSTIPFTWGSGDSINVTIVYEAA